MDKQSIEELNPADDILKKHEDANEMHFHEVDRKWIIEAMEEYAALRQFPVSGRSEQLVCSCGSTLVKTTDGYHCVNAKCSV